MSGLLSPEDLALPEEGVLDDFWLLIPGMI